RWQDAPLPRARGQVRHARRRREGGRRPQDAGHRRFRDAGEGRTVTVVSASATPLMQQYRDIKSRHQDAILFFRMGEFYEMYYYDAETASRPLGLTLTSRNN